MSTSTTVSAGSRRFWVAVVCFAIANSAVWVGYHRWVIGHRASLLEVTQFSPGDGAEVGRRRTLVWSFNLDVAPPSPKDPPPGAITPTVAGKWEWPTPRTLTFTPDVDFPRATSIHVGLSELLHTADGFRLAHPFAGILRTPTLTVVQSRQVSRDDNRAVIEFAFNDKVLPADVHNHLTLRLPNGDVLRFHPSGDAAGTTVRVMTDPLPASLTAIAEPYILVEVSAGLVGAAGPLGLERAYTAQVAVASDVVATGAQAYFPSHDEPFLQVRFNNNVDADAIRQVISVTPAVPFSISSGNSGVDLHGPFQPGTRYAIHFAKPPAGVNAKRLPRPASLTVVIPDRDPGVWFENSFGYLGAEGNRTVLAHVVNMTDLRATITRVYDNNIVSWRNAASNRGYEYLVEPYGKPMVSRDFHLPTRKNEPHDLRLALDDLLPAGEARDGVYQITLRSITPNEPRPRWDNETDAEDADDYRDRSYGDATTVVALSDIGLSAKRGRDGVVVWATSLRTAKPLAGVQVRLYSSKNQLLGDALTEADGTAKISALPLAPGEQSAVIVAQRQASGIVAGALRAPSDDDTDHGTRSAPAAPDAADARPAADHAAGAGVDPRGLTWLDLRGSEISYGDSPTTGRPYLRFSYEAFCYTDRGVYRPGETVHLRAMIRRADNATPPRFPVRWQIRRPDLRDWKAQMTEIDADGATAYDLVLPNDLPSGRWTAHVGLPGESGTSAQPFGSVSFDVEDFMPQRMKVSVELAKGNKAGGASADRIALGDDSLSASVQADYLFGRPVVERPATLVARVDPAPFAPAGWRDWTFGDAADTAETLGRAKPLGHRVELPEVVLNAKGSADFDLDVNDLIDNGPAEEGATAKSGASHRSRRAGRHVNRSIEQPKSENAPAAEGKSAAYGGPWRLTVTGSVTENGGRAVTASRAVDVDRVPYYIAARARESAPRPGVACAFDLRLIAPDGQLDPGSATLDCTLYRETWNSSYVYEQSHYRFHSTRILEPVGAPAVKVIDGKGEVTVTPPSAGSFVLLARDRQTHALTTLSFDASDGAWEGNISRENPERLELIVQALPSSSPLDDVIDAAKDFDIAGVVASLQHAMKDADSLSPSPGTPEEGRGEGLARNSPEDPRPTPLPEYREKGQTRAGHAGQADHHRAGPGGILRAGQPAQVIVRSPFAGQLLLSIETDGVLSTQVLDMPANHMAVPILIPAECRPNAYITATVIRPIDPNAAWTIHRATGVARICVDNSDRKLTIELAAPKEVRPQSTLEIPLRVVDADGHPVANAAVTVAAVDEGICQLTHFTTPDPFAFFMAPRTLGVQSADLFGQLMPEVARALHESSVGGDEDASFGMRHASPVGNKRVRPVSLVSGVLHTDEQGVARAVWTTPEFTGQLRVMAVASAEKSFGSADSPVLVRSELLVQSSWPRFAAPGDRFKVPLLIFNNGQTDGNVIVTLDVAGADSPLRFAANSGTNLTLPAIAIRGGGQATATLDVVALDRIGNAPIRLHASMKTKDTGGTPMPLYEESIELPVRPASPTISLGGYLTGTPAASVFVPMPAGLVEGTQRFELRVAALPQLQLPEGLDYLDHYPYGCVEQTTSTLFPLAYLSDIGAQIAPGMFDKDHVADKIRVGMNRFMTMQTADGGLAMWPGGHEPWPWASVYAAHFLVEAQSAGFDVPENLRDPLLGYVRNLLNQNEEGPETIELQAYASYVLALAGKPQRAVMNRLSEVVKTESIGSARFHLAAAWLAAGRRDLAGALLPQDIPAPRADRQLGGNIGSPIRDRAILLSTLLAVDPNDPRNAELAQQLADSGRARQWRSTQDTAFAVMALGHYLRQARSQTPYETAELRLDGKIVASAIGGNSLYWTADDLAGTNGSLPAPGTKLEIRVTGPDAAKAHIAWLATGIGAAPPPSADNGLTIRRRYLDEHGNPLAINRIRGGDLVQIELAIEAPGPMEHIVIDDLLPAGLEIENPRLEGNGVGIVGRPASKAARADNQIDPPPTFQPIRTDMRDDRLVLVGNLIRGGSGAYFYTARAVTAGKFVLPPVKAECMYDLGLNSLSGAGTIEILPMETTKVTQARAE